MHYSYRRWLVFLSTANVIKKIEVEAKVENYLTLDLMLNFEIKNGY